jgi:ABC-type branched-subunit amino acid transport system ATPase component/predicted MFS family arabinose efflux permease
MSDWHLADQSAEAAVISDETFLRRVLRGARGWGQLRHTPYGLTPVVVIGVVTFFQTFDSAAFTLAAPDIIRVLRIDLVSILGLIKAIAVLGLVASLGIGWLADRTRRVPIFAGGTALSGLAAAAAAGAHSPLTLSLPRAVDDTSFIAANVPSYSLLSDYYPLETRGRVFSILGIASSSAKVIALPLGGAAITFLGIRTAWMLMAAPIIVAGVAAAFLLKEPVRGYFERKAMGASEEVARTPDAPVSFGEGWRSTWAVRTLRRLFFASMATFLGQMAYIFVGFYLAEKYHLNAFQRGLIGVPGAVGAVAGGYFGGGLVDVLSKGRPERVLSVFGLFSLLCAAGIGVMGFKVPLFVLALAALVYNFGLALEGPAVAAVSSQIVPPNSRTQGLQTVALAELPVLLFGLTIFSNIRLQYGYTVMFLAAVPCFVLGSILKMSAAKFFDIDRRNATAAAVAADEWRRTQATGAGKLLVCRDLEVGYDGVQVLFGIDFDVDQGDMIALLGTNGAGKSTLLRAICGLQEASTGAVVHDGRDITHMPTNEIANRGVILMPGGRGVFPALSVKENLLLGAWMVDDDHEREQRLGEVYELFPILRDRSQVAAGTLSGGEQQQLSLAQAMLGKPKLLLIDELSLGLSPIIVADLIEKVREIHRRGTTVIIVEQSVNVALSVAHRAIFLEKGEVKFVGRTSDLLQRPDVLRSVYVKGMASGRGGSGPANDEQRRMLELEAAPAVLEVRGIRKAYGGVVALDSVDLTLSQGGVLGLIGPNGSGKTTLFDVISGFQKPDAGHVFFDGHEVTGLSAAQRAQRKLVRRFQDARMFPSLTVFETLLVALDQRMESRSLLLGGLGTPRQRRAERRLRTRADALIELLELGAFRDKFVKELSTGLRRIVDIACVVAVDPEVLLLDEPSSGIAQAEAENLAPLLRRIRYETGCSILIIEHDMPLLTRVADELVALAEGRVIVRGKPEVVLTDERVVSSYLGNDDTVVARSGAGAR